VVLRPDGLVHVYAQGPRTAAVDDQENLGWQALQEDSESDFLAKQIPKGVLEARCAGRQW